MEIKKELLKPQAVSPKFKSYLKNAGALLYALR
jgi:hypothetical protein